MDVWCGPVCAKNCVITHLFCSVTFCIDCKSTTNRGWLLVESQKLENWGRTWKNNLTDWCSSFTIWKSAGAECRRHLIQQQMVSYHLQQSFTVWNWIYYLWVNLGKTWMKTNTRRRRRKHWNNWVNSMTRWRRSWQETWRSWMNSVGCSWYTHLEGHYPFNTYGIVADTFVLTYFGVLYQKTLNSYWKMVSCSPFLKVDCHYGKIHTLPEAGKSLP